MGNQARFMPLGTPVPQGEVARAERQIWRDTGWPRWMTEVMMRRPRYESDVAVTTRVLSLPTG